MRGTLRDKITDLFWLETNRKKKVQQVNTENEGTIKTKNPRHVPNSQWEKKELEEAWLR